MTQESPATSQTPMTDEDLAFFIRTFWAAIISAPWPKDDLIDLGKFAYAKTPISDIPEKTFIRLLPHLKIVARTFHDALESRPAPPAPAPAPPAKEPVHE